MAVFWCLRVRLLSLDLLIFSGVGTIQDLVGYQLQPLTRILVSCWLPVTTNYQNFGLRVVTGYHLLLEFGLWVVAGYDWLPNLATLTGYHRLSKNRNFADNRVTAPADPWNSFEMA